MCVVMIVCFCVVVSVCACVLSECMCEYVMVTLCSDHKSPDWRYLALGLIRILF